MWDPDLVDLCAELAYEVARAYARSHGDDSWAEWDTVASAQKEAARSEVVDILQGRAQPASEADARHAIFLAAVTQGKRIHDRHEAARECELFDEADEADEADGI